jgi:hypothetical protein
MSATEGGAAESSKAKHKSKPSKVKRGKSKGAKA